MALFKYFTSREKPTDFALYLEVEEAKQYKVYVESIL